MFENKYISEEIKNEIIFLKINVSIKLLGYPEFPNFIPLEIESTRNDGNFISISFFIRKPIRNSNDFNDKLYKIVNSKDGLFSLEITSKSQIKLFNYQICLDFDRYRVILESEIRREEIKEIKEDKEKEEKEDKEKEDKEKEEKEDKEKEEKEDKEKEDKEKEGKEKEKNNKQKNNNNIFYLKESEEEIESNENKETNISDAETLQNSNVNHENNNEINPKKNKKKVILYFISGTVFIICVSVSIYFIF